MSLENIIQKIESEKLNDYKVVDREKLYDKGIDKAVAILKEESERAFSPESFGFINDPEDPKLGYKKSVGNEIFYIKQFGVNNYGLLIYYKSIITNKRVLKLDSHFTAEIIFRALGILE